MRPLPTHPRLEGGGIHEALLLLVVHTRPEKRARSAHDASRFPPDTPLTVDVTVSIRVLRGHSDNTSHDSDSYEVTLHNSDLASHDLRA